MAIVSSVTKHFPTAKEGFTTTLASTIAPGVTTVALNSVTGFNNGETIVLVVEPTDPTKKQAFTGVVDTSGIQLTDVVWTEGTNQTHNSGVTVVDYETATHWAMYSKGLLVSHNQDGTQKNNSVTTASITDGSVTNDKLASNAVTADKLASNAVTADKLATSAITLGYAQITSNFSTASTSDVQVTGLTVSVTIPAGGRKVKITVYSVYVTNGANTPVVTLWDGTVGSGTLIQQFNGVTAGGGMCMQAVVTPSAGAKTYNVGMYTPSGTATLNAVANNPAFILVEAI